MDNNSGNKLIGPILTLNYVEGESFDLNWNFRGIKIPKTYNSHYFIQMKGSNYKQNLSLFKYYFAEMNPGDIFGAVKKANKMDIGFNFTQFQKINVLNIPNNFLTDQKYFHELEDLPGILETVYRKLISREGVSMINILVNENYQNFYETPLLQSIKTTVQKMKERIKFVGAPVTNILLTNTRDIEHEIDTQIGINIFSKTDLSREKFSKFLKQYCSSINISEMEVTMELQDTNNFFGHSNMRGWNHSDFNQFKKKVYGIPIKQSKESITFLQGLVSTDIRISLKFKLSVRFVDGTEQNCEKLYEMQGNSKQFISYSYNMFEQNKEEIMLFGESVLCDFYDKHHIISIQKEQKLNKITFKK